MNGLEGLTRDYRAGFLRYLPRRSEAAMTAGYDLGRRAASGEANLLDLVRVHHQIVSEVLDQQPAPPTAPVLDAACEFLSEVRKARAALSPEAFEAGWTEGRAWPMWRAVDVALLLEAPAPPRRGRPARPRGELHAQRGRGRCGRRWRTPRA